MNIFENQALKIYNTFSIDAKSKYFATARNNAEIIAAIHFAKSKKIPLMILGGGSNLLFTKDYQGLMLKLEANDVELIDTTSDHYLLKATAGKNWHELVSECVANNYFGLENLALIPGVCGAAPVQNIGAFGRELANTIYQVNAIELATENKITFYNKECEFDYRQSIFNTTAKGKYIITDIVLQLNREPNHTINHQALQQYLTEHFAGIINAENIYQAVCAIRKIKLPDYNELGNVGSFFKNPFISPQHYQQLKAQHSELIGHPEGDKIKLAAAQLIDICGWKGFKENSIGVYKNNALVLVNYGQATGKQILELAKRIQATVYAKFQVGLTVEPEVI